MLNISTPLKNISAPFKEVELKTEVNLQCTILNVIHIQLDFIGIYNL